MNSSSDEPTGDVMLRTMAMPADTNPNGDIFGGWLLSQMDLAGANAAKRRALGRVVTVAVDAMTFHEPVEVGDELTCYAMIQRVGCTSMTIDIQAWKRQPASTGLIKVTEGVFTYVRIDEHRHPLPVDPNNQPAP